MKPYRIPQLAQPYTDYDMIQRHTELPPFSDGRSHLLYIFLSYGAGGEERNRELYTLVTGLVQLALDTHESIDRSQDDPGGDLMRSRQLKVLAGDYFSGWFYHLLAKSGQIEMVGRLSSAIADFNVMKARLYCKMKEMLLSSEQYLRHSVQLNMRLFLSFTPLIESSLTDLWEKLLAEFSHCETVCSELRRSNDPAQAMNGYSYWKLLESATEDEAEQLRDQSLDLKDWKKLKMKYKCDILLTDKLHESVQSIRDLLQGIKDEHLIRELSSALDRFLLQMKISGQAAVEGESMTIEKTSALDDSSIKPKEQFVHSVFESIAGKYDLMNDILSFRRHKAWRKFTMRKMAMKRGDSAVDLCCGTCDWSIALAEASQTGSVVGLDFSAGMLEVGRRKVESQGMQDRISLVQGNAMDLPFGDNSFDYATIGFGLRNVPDLVQVLNEMKRVVKPGGMVVCLELSKPMKQPFKGVYYFYFERVLPLLGKLFAKKYEQYKWLPESLALFPDREQLAVIFRETGLTKVESFPLTGGIAALHIGFKENCNV